MSPIALLVFLVVLGAVWLLVERSVSVSEPLKNVIAVITVLVLCLMLFSVFDIGDFRIGRPMR